MPDKDLSAQMGALKSALRTSYLSGQIVTRAELDAAVLAARSNAIRDFCNAANIQPLIQVQNLPGDVRRYRMTEAIRARGVTE